MARRNADKKQKSSIISLPAPIGGLNARDSIALMPGTDAVVLDNFFPQATSVDLRAGYEQFATFTGQCETIIVYNRATATQVFTAVRNGSTRSIFNATSGGSVGPGGSGTGSWATSWGDSWGTSWGTGIGVNPVVGGASNTVQAITNSRYDYVNYGTTGGQFLSVVNGSDTPLQYDGSTWSASTITGSELTSSTLFTVASYAERLWFGGSGFDVWYLPVQAITGTAIRLNLASLFKLGGSLSNIVTWSADTSSDLADFIAFVSSEGEVVVFSGSDPASSTSWARFAHFRIGNPVARGNRAWAKFGADAVILTVDGAVPLSLAVAQDRASFQGVSDKIRNLLNPDTVRYDGFFGWQVMLYPKGQKLIVNVPTRELESAYQYVMNSQTRSWCRFTGLDAICWESSKDVLYFGADGYLARADYTQTDNNDDITGEAQQAFNALSSPGLQKMVTMARPVLTVDGPYDIALTVNTDYQGGGTTATKTVGSGTGDPWGGAWDVAWSGAVSVTRHWNSVTGVGFVFSPRLRIEANDVNVSWSATDIMYQHGGLW